MVKPQQQVAAPRSTGYPHFGLQEALEKARVIWEHAKRSAVNTEMIAGYWKYGTKSSGWRLGVAALKHFGLLENIQNKKSGQVKLTDLAIRILLDVRSESDERDAAIRQAALMPGLYRALWEHWGGLLPGDQTIQTFLTLNKGFNEGTVKDFITEFRKTISFAKLSPSDKMPPADGEHVTGTNGKLAQDPVNDSNRSARRRNMQPGMKEDVFTLGEGPVVLQYPEKLSRESFEDFQSWLQLVIRKAKRSIQSNNKDSTKEED